METNDIATVAGAVIALIGLLAQIYPDAFRSLIGMVIPSARSANSLHGCIIALIVIGLVSVAIGIGVGSMTKTRKLAETPPPSPTDTSTMTAAADTTPTETVSSGTTTTAGTTIEVEPPKERPAGLVRIPAGQGIFGCTPGDRDCTATEHPAQTVTMRTAFWMMKTEVSARDYFDCVNDDGRCRPPVVGGADRSSQLPVVGVTFADAQRYCEWWGGRLPSEKEWEYAARGGHRNRRYASADGLRDIQHGQLLPVAQGEGNSYGLLNMSGNASEWTIGPVSSTGEPFSILRGGSYLGRPADRRVSSRNVVTEDEHVGEAAGFRCVIYDLERLRSN